MNQESLPIEVWASSKGDILVVDDTPANLRLLTRILQENDIMSGLSRMAALHWQLRKPSCRIWFCWTFACRGWMDSRYVKN